MHQDLLLTKLLMNITLPTLKMWCTYLILKLCRCISSRIANQGFYFHIKYYIWLVCAQLNPLKIRVVLWTLVKCLYCNFYLNSITFLSQLFCLCTVVNLNVYMLTVIQLSVNNKALFVDAYVAFTVCTMHYKVTSPLQGLMMQLFYLHYMTHKWCHSMTETLSPSYMVISPCLLCNIAFTDGE